MKRSIIAITACLLLSGWATQAETWKDGPHLGVVTGGDLDEDAFAFGWQVAYEFTPYVSLEGAITGHNTELTTSGILPPLVEADLDMNVVAFTLGGRAGIREEWYHMYGGAGIGYFYFDADAENARVAASENVSDFPAGITELRTGVDVDDAFGFFVSGGFEIMFNDHWEFFTDIRYTFLETDQELRLTATQPNSQGIFEFVDTTRSDKSDLDYNHMLVRFGFNYRF